VREDVIGKVVRELELARAVHGTRSLYDASRDVYQLLRYGVQVVPDRGAQSETVHLIDWSDAGPPFIDDFR